MALCWLSTFFFDVSILYLYICDVDKAYELILLDRLKAECLKKPTSTKPLFRNAAFWQWNK